MITPEAQISFASTWGNPSAHRKALLIHGLGSSSHTWIDVAPELVKKGYYVIAPDLLGHGLAQRSDTYQINDLVANILPRIAGEEIDLLLGHSLGGAVALGVYPFLKRKPRRCVLVDPALEVDGTNLDMVRKSILNDIRTRPSPAQIALQLPNYTDNASVTKALAACLASPDAIEYLGTNIRPWSFTKGLPPADDGVEIVIIGADPQQDAVFTPEQANSILKNGFDVKYIIAAGAGHGIQREQPELVVRAATAPLGSL